MAEEARKIRKQIIYRTKRKIFKAKGKSKPRTLNEHFELTFFST